MSLEEIEVPITVQQGGVEPQYASSLAAGADVRALIDNEIVVQPGEQALIPTGLRFEIPEGFEIQVRPRSGFALKNGITVLNSPGTIDADYRGELCIILINHGKEPQTITPGMRVAQIVLAPVYRALFVMKENLATTARGEKGFGHTGTH